MVFCIGIRGICPGPIVKDSITNNERWIQWALGTPPGPKNLHFDASFGKIGQKQIGAPPPGFGIGTPVWEILDPPLDARFFSKLT